MSQPSTEPDPARLAYQTSVLDSVNAGTSNRAYRACRKVLTGASPVQLGKRYVILQGELWSNRLDETMDALHKELLALCAGPITIWVGESTYWLGIEPDVYCSL